MIKKKQKAFSLVELMMILLVASLIVAAVAPVVTKKHFRLPSLVNHGAYMCYYENGQLREAKWAGKFQQQELFNRATGNCVFTPPKKAAYFQISAIGGGGGGGDAGYTGGHWVSSDGTSADISPFKITVDGLKNMMDLDDIPEAEVGPLIEEWKQYTGELIGYANSVGSGAGGDIGLINNPTKTIDCLEYRVETEEEKYCAKYERPHEGASSSTTTAEDGTTTITCTWTDCTEVETCETCSEERERTWTTGGGCKTHFPDEYYDCSTSYTTQENCRPGEAYPCFSNSCAGGGTINSGNAGADPGGGCPVIQQTCHKPDVCDTVEHKVEKTCSRPGGCAEYYPTENHSETYTHYYDCNCTTSESCTSSSSVVESESDCVAGVPNCVDWDTRILETTTDECIDWDEEHPTYHWTASTGSGAAGGSGASCQSARVKGGLGVTYSGSDTIMSASPQNGADKDVGVVVEGCFPADYAQDGMAVCAGGALSATCATPSSSTYQITNPEAGTVSVEAVSASQGGGGAGRGTATGLDGKCYNTSLSPQHTATNGSCSIGSAQTDCGGSGAYGYCLAHHYAPNSPEPGGLYTFSYGYDQNYLGYGAAGNPGQFKTTVVRSLTDLDLTIRVGRGGSAAAVDSGLAGAKGSATSMGDIIRAEGGEGGQGGLTKAAETLPTYNKERHDKESLCYYYDKYTQKNDDGSYRYNTEDAIKLRNTLSSQPNYCDGLINNQSAYKFFQIAGNQQGAYPTPTGVFSTFMNVAFTSSSSSDLFNRFVKFGRGGTGGGVEHRCWAGRHDVIFEQKTLSSSVFVDKASATPYAIAHNKYVPEGCREDYSNIPASPGVDGALLIKW